MVHSLYLVAVYACLGLHAVTAERPLIPEGFHLPGNPSGPIYGTIPGVQLPAQEDAQFGTFHPIYPYNHLFGFAFDDPQPNFDVAWAVHPANILDTPYKLLMPVWQAQQLQQGGSPNSYLPDPDIPNDRLHMVPIRPFTPRLGVGSAYSDTDIHRTQGFIDFPIDWGPDKHRFRFDGLVDEDSTSGFFRVPDFDVGKFFKWEGGITSLADYSDFHFGHSLRPVNPLGMNIKEQFATGKPSWAPFAQSIRPNQAQAALQKKDPISGNPLFLTKMV